MGKHFALALQLPFYRSEAKKQKIKAAPKHRASGGIGVYLLVGCAILAVAYLIQVNSFSTKGYQISKLQTKIATLREANKKMVIDSASLQSMQQIQSDPAIAALVPVTSINYIHPTTLTQR